MALVTYDYGTDSEESDGELLENDKGSINILNAEKTKSNGSNLLPQTATKDVHTGNLSDCEISGESGFTETLYSSQISDEEEDTLQVFSDSSILFNRLPPNKKVLQNNLEIIDDEVEDFIPKAKIIKPERGKIKISVPSLSDFDDFKDDEHVSKKFKSSSKGSGLLCILPPVKCVPISNTSFVPNVLTHKKKTSSEQVKTPSKSLVPDSVRKNKSTIKKKDKNDSEDSDDDIDLPETFDEELWLKSCGKVIKKDIIEEESTIVEPRVDLTPEVVEPYAGLNNEAFKELVGKRSRIPRNVKLIDLNEEALVADKDLWMRKSLTDPEFVPKAPIEEPVDPTKRKKHHITYLAEQAKANEQELQNQWASSKFNRNQSRAKYGF
ncbi:hypothetical protein WA026_013667 [Henosepilachna vigintioctopunctata]|uniref:Proline-rich protein PRCC n=1 Tax=Henosepilachna vigintioctopunctata TaxID=420089 RepID=A0AAW1UZ79_9CUCU